MIYAIQLLLPALIPSWRFFKTVAPSPRVEFRLHRGPRVTPWREVMPRPAHVSLRQMLTCLIWNPDWNLHLFLVTCAERLAEAPSQRLVDEVTTRLWATLSGEAASSELEFRIVFVWIENGLEQRSVDFQSVPTRQQNAT